MKSGGGREGGGREGRGREGGGIEKGEGRGRISFFKILLLILTSRFKMCGSNQKCYSASPTTADESRY